MTIDEYAKKAIATLIGTHEYGEIDARLMAQVLGLVGESGEVAEKFKKLVRDKQGILTDDDRTEILKELGDVLWYVNAVAHLLGSSLEEVAQMNNQKLASSCTGGVIIADHSTTPRDSSLSVIPIMIVCSVCACVAWRTTRRVCMPQAAAASRLF